MKYLARIGLILTLLLTFGVAANAQTREEFTDLSEGFKVAKAIEKDGSRAILVLFPEQYLKDGESYAEGTFKVLPLLFGCETFKDCKPLPYGSGTSPDGRMFVLFEVEKDSSVFIVTFKLGNDNGDPIGIIVQLMLRGR